MKYAFCILVFIVVGTSLYHWITDVPNAETKPTTATADVETTQVLESATSTEHESEVTANTSPITEATTEPSSVSPEPTITVDPTTLGSGQQQILKTFGVDTDEEIAITPEMITCAETKLGQERVEQISAGEAPTFIEGLSLVGCY